MLLAVLAAWLVHSQGWTLYYGDAEARLNNARRIIDSRTPGYEQLGTGWLPLSSMLMLPLVGTDLFWRTGLAGTIVGVVCFVAAVLAIFGTARRVFTSNSAGWCAALLLATNPNLLYLQATPMTEHIFFAMLCGLLYCTVRFASGLSSRWLIGAGLCSAGAALTRYDGWLLIPFATAFVFISGREKRWRATLLFGAMASTVPLYWFAHNFYFYGDLLEFYHGQYSAKAIYERGVTASGKRHPFDHNWSQALIYYRAAVVLCVGMPLCLMAVAGCLGALLRRAIWPVVLLAIPPFFYVLSLYAGSAEIFVPALWPHSYYNSRYGLAFLPFAAFCAASLVTFLPARVQTAGTVALLAAAVSIFVAYPRAESWICWKESQVNSKARRAWTQNAAQFLKQNYRNGDGLLFSYGDLAGVFRESGIPIREGLHEGNGAASDAAFVRPDLFLNEGWALAIKGDRVSQLMSERVTSAVGQKGPRFRLVHEVHVDGAPAIEIFQRFPKASKPRW
ncbi:MAG TPA: glycosyltransferase family 39 protein [Bryobacteraceae bacterium]|nr:glycosyltransferase family 39 protein [Bryobacteraceae bacterium]